MPTVNVHEAKSQLSRLLRDVEEGQEVVIARHGRPVARLVPIGRHERRPGALRGLIHIGDDFDDPLPSDLAAPFGA